MYSKAKIGKHPIHPMLVAFPIAFYMTACIAYVAYAIGSIDAFWFRLAYVANIAGVFTALAAAIPGFIDWAFGVPAESPAKRTGLVHMILNVSALVVFAAAAWLESRQYGLDAPDVRWGAGLSVVGIAFTLGAGFLGWKMIGTHHVGVDLTDAQERIDPNAPGAAPRI